MNLELCAHGWNQNLGFTHEQKRHEPEQHSPTCLAVESGKPMLHLLFCKATASEYGKCMQNHVLETKEEIRTAENILPREKGKGKEEFWGRKTDRSLSTYSNHFF